MQTEIFIDDAAAAAVLSDRGKAEKIALAVIETFCIYLPPEQTRRLAAQLPKPLAKAAEAGTRQALQTEGDVTAAAFYTKVAQRAELPVEQVHLPARAALRVLTQSVSDNEAIDVIMAAPGGLEALLAGISHPVEPEAIPAGLANADTRAGRQAATSRPGLSASAEFAPNENGDP